MARIYIPDFGSAFFCGSGSGQKTLYGSGSWGYPGAKGKNEFFHVSDDSWGIYCTFQSIFEVFNLKRVFNQSTGLAKTGHTQLMMIIVWGKMIQMK